MTTKETFTNQLLACMTEPILDGDFPGHPFRGNGAVKVSSTSKAAVHSSMRAKHAERHGTAEQQAKAHRTAYYSHKAASEEATGKSKDYHEKMAEFHKSRAPKKSVLDDAQLADVKDALLDAVSKGDIEGVVIGKDNNVLGRVGLASGDGKAIVFVGSEGDERVTSESGSPMMMSDEDGAYMINRLLQMTGVTEAGAGTESSTGNEDPLASARARLDADDFKRAKADITGSLAVIKGIDSKSEGFRGYDRSLFVSSIVGLIRRRARTDKELAGLLLAYVSVVQESMPKPAITPRNGIWSELPDAHVYRALFRSAPAVPEAPTPAFIRSGTEEEQAKADATLAMAAQVVADLGGTFAADGFSGDGTAGAWSYGNAEVNGKMIRLAASGGGVVQVDGKPHDPDGQVIVESNQVRAAILAVAPAPEPAEQLYTVTMSMAPVSDGSNEWTDRTRKETEALISNLSSDVAWAYKVYEQNADGTFGKDVTADFIKNVALPVPAPEPQPEPQPEPEPVVNEQENADRAYLNSLIDGTGNLLAEDTFDKLEPMFERYAEGTEMRDLLDKAATAYGDAAVKAAQDALAGA